VGEVLVLPGRDAASLVLSRSSKDLMDLGTLKMTPLNCLETSGSNTQWRPITSKTKRYLK